MKLFIWVDPYDVSYGSSMVFAAAESEEQARELCKSGKAYTFGKYEQERVPPVNLGKPDRVLELPCAEWHEWRE